MLSKSGFVMKALTANRLATLICEETCPLAAARGEARRAGADAAHADPAPGSAR